MVFIAGLVFSSVRCSSPSMALRATVYLLPCLFDLILIFLMCLVALVDGLDVVVSPSRGLMQVHCADVRSDAAYRDQVREDIGDLQDDVEEIIILPAKLVLSKICSRRESCYHVRAYFSRTPSPVVFDVDSVAMSEPQRAMPGNSHRMGQWAGHSAGRQILGVFGDDSVKSF